MCAISSGGGRTSCGWRVSATRTCSTGKTPPPSWSPGSNIDFKKPGRIDDALLVKTTYDVFKGVRLEVSQSITARRHEVLATAEVDAACIHLNGLAAPARRPDPDREGCCSPFLLP